MDQFSIMNICVLIKKIHNFPLCYTLYMSTVVIQHEIYYYYDGDYYYV